MTLPSSIILVGVHPETTQCHPFDKRRVNSAQQLRLCHPEPFDGLRACPERVEGIDSAKDLEILRRLAPQNDTLNQGFRMETSYCGRTII